MERSDSCDIGDTGDRQLPSIKDYFIDLGILNVIPSNGNNHYIGSFVVGSLNELPPVVRSPNMYFVTVKKDHDKCPSILLLLPSFTIEKSSYLMSIVSGSFKMERYSEIRLQLLQR